jgi:tetratricopeptide (TPR) repeat protein
VPKIAVVLGLAVILLAFAEIAVDARRDDAGFQARLCAALLCDADQAEDLARRAADAAVPGAPPEIRLRQLAVLNDPSSPYRWCDLGQAWLSEKAIDKARQCFRRAEQLGPRNPAVLMQLANFHFQLNELDGALARTARVLNLVGEYNNTIFSSYARFNVPLETVLAHGIPPKKESAQAYLHFLFAAGEIEDTRRAWQWAAGRSLIDDALAAEFVNRLWSQKQFREAVDYWANYLAPRRTGYLHPNMLYNGDFETEPGRCALDWQIEPVDDVQIARDPEVRYDGGFAMRLTFRGQANLDFHQFRQTTAPPPGAYRFQARVKSEGLTTDQGVRLRIYDPESPGRLDISTDALLGSTDWRLLEKTIEVSPATRIVVVEVARQPSLKFDNKIAGTLWLDAVSLVRRDRGRVSTP